MSGELSIYPTEPKPAPQLTLVETSKETDATEETKTVDELQARLKLLKQELAKVMLQEQLKLDRPDADQLMDGVRQEISTIVMELAKINRRKRK